MSTPGNAPLGGALELPPYSLDVQALDLGNEIKAVGLALVETENREPVRGAEGAEIWSEVFPALAASEAFAADFFSHIDRVREFCQARGMEWREAAERCLVIAQPSAEQLRQLFERFAGETFGLRAGSAAGAPDAALEGQLSRRGLDAYQEDGWATVLSQALWPSEIIRRVRPAVERFDVHIARPN